MQVLIDRFKLRSQLTLEDIQPIQNTSYGNRQCPGLAVACVANESADYVSVIQYDSDLTGSDQPESWNVGESQDRAQKLSATQSRNLKTRPDKSIFSTTIY